jgi:hypothetical protein
MVLSGGYEYELPHPFLQLFIQLADDDIYVSLRLLFTLWYPLSMANHIQFPYLSKTAARELIVYSVYCMYLWPYQNPLPKPSGETKLSNSTVH